MAKLGVYYGLCPLIDHRSLLGISEDEENGVVIVTLGKNIAIKYKLLDQKQLHSWRTKDKFTSPIIYDKEQQQYVAVFNESYVRLWQGNEEFLDKLKKVKFNQQIHTIFSCNGKSFIMFKNGATYLLEKATQDRKELNPESIIDAEVEYISEVLYAASDEEVYVGLIASCEDQNCLYWTKFDSSGKQEKFSKIILKRDNSELRGFVFQVDKASVNFLSLWSDGRIYSILLNDSDLVSSNVGELFTVIEAISCKEYVSLIALDQNYIAFYGCNSNEEGALLVIYNVQFKVVQSKQPFKLFTNGAKMWCLDGKLLFPVGQNLAVVPFYLDTEQLAALVGSHKVIETDPDPDVALVQKVQVISWGGHRKSNKDDTPGIIKPKIMDYLSQGLSEHTIFEALLNDFVEEKSVEMMSQSIRYFSDIPENCLAKVLKLVLNLESTLFKNKTICTVDEFPQSLQPLERAELLDIVFTKSFNATLFLPHLRSALSLNEALTLLQYIYFLLSDNGHPLLSLNFDESEAKLIEWSCILLDANYQKFLLTRDDRVNEVLSSLKDLMKEELSCFHDLRPIVSILNEVKSGRSVHKTLHMTNQHYSIEEFPLY